VPPNKHGHKKRPYHPAPGIIVDVTSAQGGSAVELQRTARNLGYWPFRRCYEEGLRREQRLSGKVSLDLSIAPGGVAQTASVAGATVSDESVALCVAREAQRLPLATPDGECRANLDVTLWPGDEFVPVAPPPPRGGELREALRASWPAVEQCYATSLAARPDAGGQMDLRFRLGSTGEVIEVTEDSDAPFGDGETTQCVLGVYRGAQLPAVPVSAGKAGGAGARFTYSLHLEAAQP
jgi:hypothetical protein